MATVLMAGRLGIEQKLALNATTDEEPDTLSEAQRQARNIVALPGSLGEALECLRHHDELFDALPKPMMETYLAIKTQELKSTDSLTPTELCDHYARIY